MNARDTAFLEHLQLQIAATTNAPLQPSREDVDAHLARLLLDESLHPEERSSLERWRETRTDDDVSRRHAAQLLSHLEGDERTRLSGVAVVTVADYALNSMTVRSGSGMPVISLTSGLLAALCGSAAWCGAATAMPGAPAEATVAETLHNLVATVACLVTRSATWLPTRQFVSRYSRRRAVIAGLFDQALNFVLGHEYGHILLGHLAAGADGSPARQRELDADAKGVKLAIASSRCVYNGWVGGGAAGVELALQVLRLQEACCPHVASDHPTAEERLDRIHADLRATYGDPLVDGLRDIGQYFDSSVGAVSFSRAFRCIDVSAASSHL
jgi:hypothetical protein